MLNIFEEVVAAQKENKKAVLCIVINKVGSGPQIPGSKMIVYEDGSIKGTIGGGNIELTVIEKAKELMRQSVAQKLTFDLEDDLSMACGGSMEVYIETINPLPDLFIFGAGHVGKAVAQFAYKVGFNIHLIDPRENIFSDDEKNLYHCIQEDYLKAIDSLNIHKDSYNIVVTPQHAFDEALIAVLGKKEYKYLGMIGSTKKVALLKQRFLSENILSSEQLEKIDMPIGIKIAAQTPEEIAISILAKLIDVKNQH
ncbi:MAG: XdhC family protein [Bacteroidales bacterium]|nr:XdhC family protein [Bacteroidales bacterium]